MKLSLWYPVKSLFFHQLFGENKVDLYKKLGMLGHNGVDFMAVHGQAVYAAHDGICYPEIDANGGNGVVIRTPEPFEYNGNQVYFKTIYWHLLKADAVVKTGQRVNAGDLIGYADNTGASTGDHLHFGLKPCSWNENEWIWYNTDQANGYFGAIDPIPYFNRFFAQDKNLVISLYQKMIMLMQQVAEAFKNLPPPKVV